MSILSYRQKINLKYILLGPVRRVLLLLFGAKVSKEGWQDRVLIINLHGMGDVIMATPVLRYYRKFFAGKKIYLLVAEQSGMNKTAFGDDIDFVIKTNSRSFGFNPLYALKTLNTLRRIGFETVIEQCISVKDMPSEAVSVSLGAKSIFGYEGIGIELADPTNDIYLRFLRKYVFPKYTNLVGSIDRDFKEKKYHPKFASVHHLKLCEAVTGYNNFEGASTIFNIDAASAEASRRKLASLGYSGGKYVVMVLGASDGMKRWSPSNFAVTAKLVNQAGYQVIVVGSKSERGFTDSFGSDIRYINASGELSILESAAAIKDSYCVITNDTGPVHIAVALGVPTICIAGCAHLYTDSFYGRRDINKWIFKDVGCVDDDWQCAIGLKPDQVAPCIAAVKAEDMNKEFSSLDKYLRTKPTLGNFELGF